MNSEITSLNTQEIGTVSGGAAANAYGQASAFWGAVAVGAAATGLEPVAFAAGIMSAYDAFVASSG